MWLMHEYCHMDVYVCLKRDQIQMYMDMKGRQWIYMMDTLMEINVDNARSKEMVDGYLFI